MFKQFFLRPTLSYIDHGAEALLIEVLRIHDPPILKVLRSTFNDVRSRRSLLSDFRRTLSSFRTLVDGSQVFSSGSSSAFRCQYSSRLRFAVAATRDFTDLAVFQPSRRSDHWKCVIRLVDTMRRLEVFSEDPRLIRAKTACQVIDVFNQMSMDAADSVLPIRRVLLQEFFSATTTISRPSSMIFQIGNI